MKKRVVVVLAIFTSMAFGSVELTPECQAKFMQDPCSVDGYAMVEIEEFVAGGHNQMYDIHHYAPRKVTKKHRRVARKGYKVVKKCRYVKVRR
jgi:hypothetical protein